ncbi:MAG: hypothetical protein KKA76_09940, partial [Proteobacteria bacterium]|nr:hypothetical protein [Pseudomonadota bacterium]
SALQFSEAGVKRVTAGSSHGNPTWLPQGNSTGEIPQRETSILAARHLWERLQPRRVVGEPPMTVFAVQGRFAVETAPTQTSSLNHESPRCPAVAGVAEPSVDISKHTFVIFTKLLPANIRTAIQ